MRAVNHKPCVKPTIPQDIASHTAVIAQSGSGKSFFLGRLIEEIAVRTKARCMILDPNADFKKVDQIEDEVLWKNARYDIAKRRGKLPHEACRQDFEKEWAKLSIRIRGNDPASGNYQPLKLWWPSLSVEFLGEDLDPMLRSDLYHCHALVRALETLWKSKKGPTRSVDLFQEAQRVFRNSRSLSEDDFRKNLTQEFVPPDPPKPDKLATETGLSKAVTLLRNAIERMRKKRVLDAIDRIAATRQYVSEAVERFYFGKIREYMAAKVLDTTVPTTEAATAPPNKIEVIDLPSLGDKSTRLLAINALLTSEWEEARQRWDRALREPPEKDTRVPTFIVVDEAHNLLPVETHTKAETALREQFRTIIAEGRKYGLFLVIVSQRPDKLDPMILSECENRAIMKLGSETVLDVTRRMLGLDDLPQRALEKCLEFEQGRVLLTGRWSPEGPRTIYSAARRTVEGGRNLREQYWALP